MASKKTVADLDFTDRRVLVTGGTQGIGLSIAREFHDRGAVVFVTGTRASAADYDDDLTRFGYFQLDLADRSQREALVAEVKSLDVLVNNAATTSRTEYEITAFEKVTQVNLVAVADLCFMFHGVLAEARGSIVNIGSSASFLAIRRNPAYTASKTGLLGLTRALADQWAPDGIRVNMVAPGFIETSMTAAVKKRPGAEARLLESIPAQRWGRPEDVAHAALFLASPLAAYITGHAIVVDGGLMLR